MIFQPNFSSTERRETTVAAARVSSTEERTFRFNKLSQTDDEGIACYEEAIVKNIGTIQLRLYRVTDIVENYAPPTCTSATDPVLHEQSKKAQLSHQTR